MRSLIRLLCAALTISFAVAGTPGSRPHVVLIVWDGMRPDFISEQHTPALASLTREGVTFRNHHAVYLSSTEVNGTAISTGCYPGKSGIVGNDEYRPEIDPLKPVHTENIDAVRKGDSLSKGHYLLAPTIAEIVRRHGGSAIVAGAKPVALLADRHSRSSEKDGVNFFAGATLPANVLSLLTNRYGAFPVVTSVAPTRIDWTTDALIESIWGGGVPDFSFVWMNEPDFSQHLTSPGSERSLAAMANSDKNLARILRALEDKGVRDLTDVLVVSDHGASTITNRVDVADLLTKAGVPATREFKSPAGNGDVLAVSDGGSTLVYVMGHDQNVIKRIVRFFQQAEFAGVIFTRKPMPGTFAMREARIDSDNGPDIFLALRWTADKNRYGTAGMIYSDVSTYGPGQGSHVTLSAYDMHATLVAAGPHFRKGVASTLASGNVDVAPTVLRCLGIHPPKSMDGRVLTEALTVKGPKLRSFEPYQLEASATNGNSKWTQYLKLTEVNGVRYLDEGNGKRTE